MKTRTFSFDLPPELIAQQPLEKRESSRLMVLSRTNGTITHSSVSDICNFVPSGSLLVLNDTKVRKARLIGSSGSGAKVEALLINRQNDSDWRALMQRSKRQRVGTQYRFPGGVEAECRSIEGRFRTIRFSRPIDDRYLNQYGHVPLPPYIHREDVLQDQVRYQTVFAQHMGSIAAPTAGLHFSQELLTTLQAKGVAIHFVTLHVGVGTFLPITSDTVEDHVMHEEEYEISPKVASAIQRAIDTGKQITAVGTTVVRTLESATENGRIRSGRRKTGLFIYPGYRFNAVNALFTNFHTPESSLLVLVASFAGWDRVKMAYSEAIHRRYRFFSYGDAMLII